MPKTQSVASIQYQLVKKSLIFTQLVQFRTSIHPNIRTTALGTKREVRKDFSFFVATLNNDVNDSGLSDL